MRSATQLRQDAQFEASRYNVSIIHSTADGQHFISKHNAETHARTTGLKVHTFDFAHGGDGGGTDAQADAKVEPNASATAPQMKGQGTGDKGQEANKGLKPLAERREVNALPSVKEVVAAIAAATDAKGLAAASLATDTRPEVIAAAAAKRKELLAEKGEKEKGENVKTEDTSASLSEDTLASLSEDLTVVNGVGAATAKKLVAAGITTVELLSTADATKLAAATGLNKKVLQKVITEAGNKA
jgi:predicted flap endonuclease-1-like 5' DNA nuclease